MEKMYINNSNKLSKSQRFTIVQRWHNGYSAIKIAKRFAVSRQTVYNIIRAYKHEDVYGLQDHKPGILRTPLHPSFYANIIAIRKKKQWGACKIEKHFKSEGFKVSHNKINQVIQYEYLTRKKLGKMAKPKYISYEAKNNNDQWHMDWSVDPLSKKPLLAIIDDKSRFIVFAGLFESANAENSAIGLRKAIAAYGAPKELVTDNGSHFKNVHTKKTPCEELQAVEKKHDIKHIFIRAHYPQSNGKIERWFGSYKGEFPIMQDPEVTDCMTWVHYYNYGRIHQSLDYKTPAEIYLGVKSI
jgi:putative transposase